MNGRVLESSWNLVDMNYFPVSSNVASGEIIKHHGCFSYGASIAMCDKNWRANEIAQVSMEWVS